MGAQVRKGEKATAVVFWQTPERPAEEEKSEEETKAPRRMIAKAYWVFNVAQVEGYKSPEVPKLPEAERADEAEAFLFGVGADNYFQRGLRISRWKVLKGWHVLRHSFISALASKGVDQRIIDSFVGHCTEEQRRRYAHLYPDVQEQALREAFG
jgi:hypothetical protein